MTRRTTVRLLLSAVLLSAPLSAQTPTIGFIELYGLRDVAEVEIRAVLGVQVGDTQPASTGEIIDRLEAIPGVNRQDFSRTTVEGPISGGDRGQPFGAMGDAGLSSGYVETEWFLSGIATSYAKANEWTTDGRWQVTPDEEEPFRVRMLVRRPADASAFNGIVVVEWLNVTARAEGAADYSQMEEELLRRGYAWIGVGAQAVGIEAPGTGLKAWDPSRYGSLRHPGDRFSYDIFSQAAWAVRNSAALGGPLGGLPLEHLLAAGRSQSAFRLVTYVNAIHPRDRLFDGYFVHSRGANAAGLRAEAMAADEREPVPSGAWIRSDLEVPVFDLQTEGDMVTLGSHRTRQPAGETYRRWEISGAAHTEIPRWVVEVPPELPLGPGCAEPVNTAPHHAFVKAGLRALVDWVAAGEIPPQSPEIQLGDPSSPDPVIRDEYGNALGGVRTPQLEAPTATLNGLPNSVGATAPGGQNFCRLYGNTRLFDDGTLRELYPSHAAFVVPFLAAVDALEQDGYLLAPEATEARRAATEATIGR
jgi:hypothetical protein